MSDKIQYDHGTFYGLRDVPEVPVDFPTQIGYDMDIQACIAARKRIGNYHVLDTIIVFKDADGIWWKQGKQLKDGDIFDLPDSLKFIEIYKPDKKVLRLVENQELTLDGYLNLIGADRTNAIAMTIWRTLQEHSFTIKRKG